MSDPHFAKDSNAISTYLTVYRTISDLIGAGETSEFVASQVTYALTGYVDAHILYKSWQVQGKVGPIGMHGQVGCGMDIRPHLGKSGYLYPTRSFSNPHQEILQQKIKIPENFPSTYEEEVVSPFTPPPSYADPNFALALATAYCKPLDKIVIFSTDVAEEKRALRGGTKHFIHYDDAAFLEPMPIEVFNASFDGTAVKEGGQPIDCHQINANAFFDNSPAVLPAGEISPCHVHVTFGENGQTEIHYKQLVIVASHLDLTDYENEGDIVIRNFEPHRIFVRGRSILKNIKLFGLIGSEVHPALRYAIDAATLLHRSATALEGTATPDIHYETIVLAEKS